MKLSILSRSSWTRCKFALILLAVSTVAGIIVVSRSNNTLSKKRFYANKAYFQTYDKLRANGTMKQRKIVMLSQADEDELQTRLKKATDNKIILVWISGFGAKISATVNTEKCGNCEVTDDRGKLNDEKTTALIFHFDALRPDNVPRTRNPKHLYIFWDMESTSALKNVHKFALKFEDSLQFNATYTHRSDSDYYSPYGNIATMTQTILEGNKITPEELLRMKTKTAVAIVSNCDYTPGAKKRLDLLKEVMNYDINVDGYGACLGGRNFAHGLRNGAVYNNEVRKYKFYFAFENAYHCKDYITEKFFDNALASFSVPVVWGSKREDYEAVAPPGSFIHAEDFSSMKELAEYLKYLDQNDEAYMEYLRWITMKPSDLPQYGREAGWCQICRTLHGINVDDIYNPKYDPNNPKRPLFTEGVARRTVPSLSGWFYGEETPECLNT